MGTVYVARSTNLCKWGSDVGLSKHIYRLAYTEGNAKEAVAEECAGERDWTLIKKQDGVAAASADELIDRVAARVKMIDPNLYPRIKGVRGIFKVPPTQVENHMLMALALADEQLNAPKLKHPDFASFLIANALPPGN